MIREIKRLGETLAAIRMLASWSLDDLAIETGIPKHRLKAIEFGRQMTKTEYLAIRVIIEDAVYSSDEESVFPAAVCLLLDDCDTTDKTSDMKKFVIDSLIAVAATGATVNAGMTDGLKKLYEGLPSEQIIENSKEKPYYWLHSISGNKDKEKAITEDAIGKIEEIPRDYEGILDILEALDLSDVDIEEVANNLCKDQLSEDDYTICKHIFEDIIDFWQSKKVPKGASQELAEMKIVLEQKRPERTEELISLAIICGEHFQEYLIASGKGPQNYFSPKLRTAYNKYTKIDK